MNVKTIAILCILIVSTATKTIGKMQGSSDGSFFAVGLEQSLHGNGRSGFIQHIRSCVKRSRRRPSYLTDLGYGSRILSASRLVRALLAYYDLFGAYGPGRKKR